MLLANKNSIQTSQVNTGHHGIEKLHVVSFRGQYIYFMYCYLYPRKLCDQDGDGRVNVDEFCAALWLAERVTQGTPVPNTLPSDLIPAPSASGNMFSGQNSFEDKRKENFERGRMELERRKREIKEKEDRVKVRWYTCDQCG